MNLSKICLALDGLSVKKALHLTRKLGNRCHAIKIHDLYDTAGGHIVRRLLNAGAKRVWVDVKLKDTPETAALRASAIMRHGATIITVHASGGVPMMKAVVDAVFTDCGSAASIWAITVLTSLDAEEIAHIHGADRIPKQIVLDFALDAKKAGLNGVVCSAEEVETLAEHPSLQGMALSVPGTRSIGVSTGGQKRTGTPKRALEDGATYIVVGSQVTKADDPVAAFEALEAEIG